MRKYIAFFLLLCSGSQTFKIRGILKSNLHIDLWLLVSGIPYLAIVQAGCEEAEQMGRTGYGLLQVEKGFNNKRRLQK